MAKLRQGVNKVEITGVVKEQKLQVRSNDKGKYINGSLVIKAGETKEIEVKTFVNQMTSQGTERKVYTTLKQLIDGELNTMADGVSEEEATKVRIWGNDNFTARLKEEIFKPENAPSAVTKIVVDLGFGNISVDPKVTPEDYKATFDVEMFVNSIQDEEKDEEETGRVLIKGWVPDYQGKVMPLEIVAGIVKAEDGEEIDFAEQLRDSLDEGDTIYLYGDIDYKTIIEKFKIGGKLGVAKVEEKRTYVNDLLAKGAEIIEEDKEFDEELITKAISEREIHIEAIENEKSKKTKKVGLKSSARSTKIPF